MISLAVLIRSTGVGIGGIVGVRVNGWAVDFWVLGVLAWLMFFFFVWSVVWSTCCLLGVLLCKWVMQHLESPPQPRAENSRSSPRSRSDPHRPLLGQLPRSLQAIPSLKTCPNGKRYMPRPTRSGGRVSASAAAGGRAHQD